MKSNQQKQKMVFLMPGQGSYSDTSLSDLILGFPELKRDLEIATSIVRRYFGKDLPSYIFPFGQSKTIESVDNDFEISQCVIYLMDYFIQKLIRAEGITPDYFVGHSIAEIPALAAAGAITFEDGLKIICLRTQAILQYATPGTMLAVKADPKRIQSLIEYLDTDQVSVAAINSHHQGIISGATEVISQIEKLLEVSGVQHTRLKSKYPFHSNLMFRAVPFFYESMREIRTVKPSVPVFSPILGRFYKEGDDIKEELARQLLVPVQFAKGIAHLYRDGVRTFVEAGGKNALTALTKSTLDMASDVTVIECNPKGMPLKEGILHVIATLKGADILEVAKPKPIPKETLQAASLNSGPSDLAKKVKSVYQKLTNYPEDVLDVNADLESELGLDSVKQLEILGHIFKDLGLTKPEVIELSKYNTIGKTVELIASLSTGVPTSPQAPMPTVISNDGLSAKVIAIYQNLTNYPADVLDPKADLESELGLDSVKQLEILSKLFSEFKLSAPQNIELSKYNNIEKVISFIGKLMGGETPSVVTTPIPKTESSKNDVLEKILVIYQEVTNYPREVLDLNADLESELGLDSVKQIDIVSKVFKSFNLPVDGQIEISKYNTIGKVSEYVNSRTNSGIKMAA